VSQNSVQVARQLIMRHGLRAGAVAQEYASEARLGGQTASADHWQAVQAAIAELRDAARKAAARAAAD
jgi:hypothetical protein